MTISYSNRSQVMENKMKKVMISSTIENFPKHRIIVQNAIVRANMYPLMMEYKEATDNDALDFSLGLVGDADYYIGLIGFRYGYIPKDKSKNPKELSITELEYREAIKLKKIPLIFIMSDNHPVEPTDFERNPEKLEKLNKFKDAVCKEHTISYFDAPEQLELKIYQSLNENSDKEISDDDNGVAIHSALKVKHNLPNIFYSKFIGRLKEKQDVVSLLKPYPESQYPLVTIDGLGGVGKTTLALEIANLFVRGYESLSKNEKFDAVIWTSAKKHILTHRGIQERDRKQTFRNLGDIFSEIARVYDRPDILAVNIEDQNSIIRQLLTHYRTLLIIDNLETVDDESILSFLREVPAPTKAIITSRHRIDGAISLRVEGLEESERTELIDLECHNKGLTLRDSDKIELANCTGGIPLAIQWTIGQISYGSTNEIKRIIRKLNSSTKPYSQFVFSETLQLLKKENKTNAIKTLLSLSLFAESAKREAIGYVAGIADKSDRDEALDDLIRLSLINIESGRYSMLSLTKEYCKPELAGDLQIKEELMSRWFNWHIQVAGKGVGGQVDLFVGVFANLNEEHSNVLWAIDTSQKLQEFTVFSKILRGISFFWLGAGYWRELEIYLNLGRLLSPTPQDKIHFSGRLLWLYVLEENFSEAQNVEHDTRNLLEDTPDEYETMRLEDFTGQLYLAMNDYDKASAHLKKSLELAIKLNDMRGQAACHKYLGELYCKLNELTEASKCLEELEQTVGIDREEDREKEKWIRAFAHVDHLRGLINLAKGNYTTAVTNFRNCLEYLDIWTDVSLQTKAREGLAIAKYSGGNIKEAVNLLRKNQKNFERLGMKIKIIDTEKIISDWECGN